MAETLAISGGTPILKREDYLNWPVITDDDRKFVNEVLDSGIVAGGTGPHYYQEIFASPHAFDRIYIIDVRMQVSDDGGKTWRAYLSTQEPGKRGVSARLRPRSPLAHPSPRSSRCASPTRSRPRTASAR